MKKIIRAILIIFSSVAIGIAILGGAVLVYKYCDHRFAWYDVPNEWLDADERGTGVTSQRQFRRFAFYCLTDRSTMARDIVHVNGVGVAEVIEVTADGKYRISTTDGREMTVSKWAITARD